MEREEREERREAFVRLGRKLARLRESRGWEIYDLASRARVGYQQVYRIERGDFATAPAFDVLVKIGAALGLSPNDLAEEVGLWKDEGQGGVLSAFFAALEEYVTSQPEGRRAELLQFLTCWLRVERERAQTLAS